MSIILSALHTLVLTSPSHPSQERKRILCLFFGRSVRCNSDKNNKTVILADKELTQSELNQKHPQALEQQSHCQFYADCADCQRFTRQPGDTMNLSQPHTGENPSNTNEGCKRIKPSEMLAQSQTLHNNHQKISKN